MRSTLLALGLLAMSLAVGCGGSDPAPEEQGSDEGALCVSLGFLGSCTDTGPKTRPQGWPIPSMVLLYSDHFTLPMAALEKMTPLKMNPAAVEASVRTSSADSQGITCDKTGPNPGQCSFSLLVEASLVKDEAGAPIASSYSYKPASFAVHGKMAETLAALTPDGVVGPLACKKVGASTTCATKTPFGAIVTGYTPNNDTSRALAESSLEPPTSR